MAEKDPEKLECSNAELNYAEEASLDAQNSRKPTISVSIEKNTFVESENSTEYDYIITEKSKKVHEDDEVQVGAKSESKAVPSDVSSNESEKLNGGPSIDRIETIETVLKAEEKSNDKKITVDSFPYADDDKSIDAENKISDDDLTDYVIESTQVRKVKIKLCSCSYQYFFHRIKQRRTLMMTIVQT